jgi:GNAT superfamily N-acetyltransferase
MTKGDCLVTVSDEWWPATWVTAVQHNAGMAQLEIRDVGYHHPDAGRLIAEVQAEYVVRYGGPDDAHIASDQFDLPDGRFAVGYCDGEPVAMGGWRRLPVADPRTGWADPAAEIKRMFVVERMRGAGFARAMLAYLERSAAGQGIRWLLLETGSKQPEALALYRSSGYADVPPFGHYADQPLARHLGKQVG